MVEDASPLSRRVLSGTGQQVLARLWSAACSLAALLAIGRTVSDEAFGVYSYYFPLFVMAGTALDFGSFSICVREIARAPEREGELLRHALAFRLLVGGILAAVISSVAMLQEDASEAGRIALASLHLLALGPGIFGAHFHARIRLLPVALSGILGSTVHAGLSLALAATDEPHPGSYLLAFGAGVATQSLSVALFAGRRVHWVGSLKREVFFDLLREMAPLGASAALSTFYFWVDTLLLRGLAGEAVAGTYNRSYRLMSLSLALPIHFTQALLPVFSRLARSDRSALTRAVQQAVRFLGAVALPATALAPALGRALLQTVWGDQFDEEGVRCLYVLAVAGALIFLSYPQITALIAVGRQGTCTWVALLAGILKVALACWWIPYVGILGAAAATLATEAFVLFAVRSALRRTLDAFGPMAVLVRPLLVAGVIGVLGKILLSSSGIWSLVAGLGLLMGGLFLSSGTPFDLRVQKE